MSDQNSTSSNSSHDSENESVKLNQSQNVAKDDVLNNVIKNLTEIAKNFNSVTDNLTQLSQRLKETCDVNHADSAKHLSAIKSVDEKCDIIHNNVAVIASKLDKLDDVENEISDISKNVDAFTKATPSVIEFSTIGTQMGLLNNQVTLMSNVVKQQSADAEVNCKRVMANTEIIRSSLINFLSDVENDQVANQQNTVNNFHSTPDPDNRFDQSRMSSHLLNESVQGARGGLEHTPARNVEHQPPGNVQTRAQKLAAQKTQNQTHLNDDFRVNDFNDKSHNPPQSANFDNRNQNQFKRDSFDPRNQNIERQLADDFREAQKTCRQLCRNTQQLEKYDESKHSKGYFIRSRIFTIAERNQITNIIHVIPWIPLCFPNCPEMIEREIVATRRLVNDDAELCYFLNCLARRCNRPFGRGVETEHLTRKNGETLSDHVSRLFIEHITVVDSEDEITLSKSESKIAIDIFNHLRYRDNEKVRQIINLCAQNFGPIKNRKQLELLVEKADSAIVNGPGSSVSISAVNYNSYPKADQPARYDQKLYPKPQTSPEKSEKNCASCTIAFMPIAPSHEFCVNCYGFQRKMNGESKSYSQQKSSYPQQNRNRYGNNNNNFNNRRRIAIVEACGNDNQTDYTSSREDADDDNQAELCLMSHMPDGPLDGNEITEDSYLFNNRDVLVSTLTGLGYPKTRARVFVEFTYTGSDTKGRALIDSGANTDAMSAKFVSMANVKNVQSTETTVRDFQGKSCRSHGKADACLQLGKVFYKGNFIIFDGDLRTDVILGMPFLNNFGLGDIIRETMGNITGPNTVFSDEPKN